MCRPPRACHPRGPCLGAEERSALRIVRWRHPQPRQCTRADDREPSRREREDRVPGFYEKVVELTTPEREEISGLPFDEKEWLSSTGSPATYGEKGFSTLERVWARPTLDCNGIGGRLLGRGLEDHHPRPRDGEDQLPSRAPPRTRRHFWTRRKVPSRAGAPGCQRAHHQPPWWEALPRADRSPRVRAREACVFPRFRSDPPCSFAKGGSIPFVRTIADVTGKPCLLMGFGQPDENAHAPNEWLDLENFHLGIKSAAFLYDELSRLEETR